MKSKLLKLFGLALGAVILMSIIPGCASDSINVKINDAFTQTRISVVPGKTVADVLSEAEIKLGKSDTVTPSEKTALNKNCTVTISRRAATTITCDGKTYKVTMVGATVGDALKKAGVKMSGNDYINYDKAAFITDGMKISVHRRLAVLLTENGKTKKCLTESKTVKDFLKEQKIKLGKHDAVSPKLSTKLKESVKVVVKHITYKTVTKIEKARYTTRYEESSSMAAGTSAVTVKGKNGKKKVTYQVMYVDGKEKQKKKLSEKIIKKPVDEVVTKGKEQTQPTTQKATNANGKVEVSRQRVDDCDGSGHGYYVIKYSDGSKSYEEY